MVQPESVSSHHRDIFVRDRKPVYVRYNVEIRKLDVNRAINLNFPNYWLKTKGYTFH